MRRCLFHSLIYLSPIKAQQVNALDLVNYHYLGLIIISKEPLYGVEYQPSELNQDKTSTK